MRLTGTIFFCCLLSLPAFARRDYTELLAELDRQHYHLHGPVLKVSEKSWAPPPDSLFYSTRDSFTLDAQYTLTSISELTFDTSGHILMARTQRPDKRKNTPELVTEEWFYYDGRELSAYTGLHEEGSDSVSFVYRKNGQVDYYAVFNDKRDLQYRMTFTFKNGRVTTVRKKDEGNMPVAMIKYYYSKGKLRETQHFDVNYRLYETRRYADQPAKEGRHNESFSVTDADGHIKSGLSLVKDSEDRILEQSLVNDKREVTDYRSFVYDDKGQPVAQKIFSATEEATVTNRYKYDEAGNWIRKETFYNGALRNIVLREFQYL